MLSKYLIYSGGICNEDIDVQWIRYYYRSYITHLEHPKLEITSLIWWTWLYDSKKPLWWTNAANEQHFSFLSSRAIVLLHLAFSSSLPSPWFISFKSYIIFLIFWPDVVDSLASLSSYAERSHFSYCNIVKKDQRSLTRKDHRLGGKSKRTVDSWHPGQGIGPGSGCPRFIYSWFLATLHYNCRSPKNIVGISKPRSSHFQEDTFATWFVQHLKNHLYRGMSTRDYTFAGSRASSSSQLQGLLFIGATGKYRYLFWDHVQVLITPPSRIPPKILGSQPTLHSCFYVSFVINILCKRFEVSYILLIHR